MKHFYLIANPLKAGTEEMAVRISDYLHRKGAECVWYPQKPDEGSQKSSALPEPPDNTECVITLGGDGTLIRAAKNLVGRRIPMLGINMGTLGYLTQIAPKEALFPMLDELMEDNYSLEYRMMLKGEVTPAGDAKSSGPREEKTALNDIVVTRNGGLNAIHFTLDVNGRPFNDYSADGLIVATPTGSTAYNFSAGGPIVSPEAKLMLLTPICSHSLYSRSIVLSGDDVVTIRMLPTEGKPSRMAVFDGGSEVLLDETRALTVSRSSEETAFVRMQDTSFLDNLREKMMRI